VSGRASRVHLCGPLRVELDGRRAEGALPGRQGRLLFAYLLLERDRGATRDELAALLWPGRPPPHAAGTLRALLSKLRTALGADAVVGSRELRIDFGDEGWIDVEVAVGAAERGEQAIAGGAWREAWSAAQIALSIASRRFLPGDDGEWIEAKRRELEDVRLAALAQLAQVALELEGSELVAGERCARALVEAAPYRESGYLLLMKVLAARGDPAEAVRVYDRARSLLRDELGVAPSAELRALNEQLVGVELETSERPPPGRGRPRSALPPLLAAPQRTPLIGRTAELGRLVGHFEEALESGPCAATLAGEPGIGKTRVISELAHAVSDRGGVVLYGAAPHAAGSPYDPFLAALGRYLEEAAPPERARLRAIDPPMLTPLLPELGAKATKPTSGGPRNEEGGRRRTLAALTRVLVEIAARAPLLLALDDMHWADAASLELVAHVLGTAPRARLLVAVAYRPAEVPLALAEAFDRAGRRAPIEQIELGPLSEREVELLVGAWTGSGASRRFVRDLHRRTEGNPFFIVHLLRHLVRAGAIDPDARRWASAADIWAQGLPAEVRDLLELRLSPLGDRGRAALAAASVIGQEFPLEVLERVLAAGDELALDTIDAALHAGLLAEHPDQPGTFRFAHALIREALYSKLSTARRGRLHRRVGEAIESLSGAEPGSRRAELARHFVAAARAGEDPLPGIRHSLAAAEQARLLFANEQAESHYHVALELLARRSDPVLHAVACEGLGDVLAARARYSEAIDSYLEALSGLPAGDATARARLERNIGRTRQRMADGRGAAEAFDRAERELRNAGGSEAATAEMIELGLDRLTLFYWQGNTAAMGRVIAQLEPVVAAQGTPVQQIRLLSSMRVRELRRRRYRAGARAIDLARRELAAAELTGDPMRVAIAEFQVGFSVLWADHPGPAVGHLERALELSSQTASVMLHARTLAYLSTAHRRRSSRDDAERTAHQALDAAIAANMPEYQVVARANLAWVAAVGGEAAGARELGRAALAQFAELAFQMPLWPPLALWPLMAAALMEGDMTAASVLAAQLLDPRHRPPSRTVAGLLKTATAAGKRDPAQARRHLLRALELADGITLGRSAEPAMAS
jgi:DNA-binding SARP family transcriptional activator